MNGKYLLDSNIIIDYLRGDSEVISKVDEIENLYDVGITEIQTEPKIQKQVFDQTFLTEYNKVLYENQDLKEKLNQLVDEVQSDSSKSQLSAARDLIVQLRIKLKQGNKLEDFSNEFPFNLKSENE